MILSHKAIRTISDFQGEDPDPGRRADPVEPLKKTGAIPVSLPLGEALPAMQNKTIDGMVGVAALCCIQYYDIAKPMTFLPATLFARQWWQPPIHEIARARAGKIVRGIPPRLRSCFRTTTLRTSKQGRDLAQERRRGDHHVAGQIEAMSISVAPVAASILSANPKIKDDYEALLAAARKYRQ
jgi:hypothetical protein